MRLVSYGERKQVAAALKPVYTAPSEKAAAQALADLEASQIGARHPQVVASWKRAWERFIPFLAFPPALRRVISPPLRGRCPLYQRDRVAQLPAAQGHQEPRSLPLRPGGGEAAVPGDLRHPWTREPPTEPRTPARTPTSASPRHDSSRDASPAAGSRPWPSSPPPTPNASTPTSKPIRLHRKLDRLARPSSPSGPAPRPWRALGRA